MRVQLLWTTIAELLVLLSGVLVLKLAADLLSPAEFGEYTVSRRAISLLSLPLMLGIGIAAPRYIAIAGAGALRDMSVANFANATLVGGIAPTLFVAAILLAVPGFAATLLFGSPELSRLVLPSCLALMGLAVHSAVYAVFRGRSEMVPANLLQMLNHGVVPLAAILIAPARPAVILTVMGAGWILTSAAAALLLVAQLARSTASVHSLRRHLRVLLRYGLPRVPGEFALVGLFAFPALVALHRFGLVAAGQMSAALTLLTLATSAFTPVGLVILPRVSAEAAVGNLAHVRRLVERMLALGVGVTVAAVIVGELMIGVFVSWFFGADFMSSLPVFRICVLSAVPYVVYVLLRNVLDALDVRALNSRNLLVSLVMLVVLCQISSDLLNIAYSLLASLTVLAGLSLRDTYFRLSRSAVEAARPAAA